MGTEQCGRSGEELPEVPVGMTSEYSSPVRRRRTSSQKIYLMTWAAWREPSNDQGDQASNEMENEKNMKTKPFINMGAFLLSCLLLLATPLFARESTDIIVMKNGDHLTGEIKGLNNGVRYVSMEYILGTSSLQWSKVARLESKQLFLVKTADGSVYMGTINTANTAG